MSAVPKPGSPGRPKDLEKRAAILAAAQRLFVSRGYEATSMDAVAAAAGVSKLTVYNHFSDKETLFRSAVNAVAEQYLPHDLFEPQAEGDGEIEARLRTIAQRYYAMTTSTEAEAVHRMLAADMRTSQQLGPAFYEAGPRRVLDDLTALLERAVAASELAIEDCACAAKHLLMLLKGEMFNRLVWSRTMGEARDGGARHVDSVLRFFLRAYRAR
jgi:TetR/AcrR family transcriptional repressor of mexJK operon